MPKVRTLTIRLLRDGKGIDDAFASTYAAGQEKALTERPWPGIDGGRLFIGQIFSKNPSWLPFLQTGFADLPGDLTSEGAGAILFLPVGQHILGVCFGHIHLALNDDAFDRQFGLRTTLNSVPRSKLRTLDLATPDAVTFQKRVQASKDSDLYEFGVDTMRDLARVAGGTPSDLNFARFIAGREALSLTCEVELNTLYDKCAEILEVYKKEIYQKDYSWIDQMRIVREKERIAALDQKLFDALAKLLAGEESELHLAPPEIVDYTEGSELHYNGFGSHGVNFHSLSIEDYVSELKRCGFEGGIADIKEKHRIRAKGDGDEEFSEKWRIYDCFVFETTLAHGEDLEHFVLFAGTWYRIEKVFKEQVEDFFNSIATVVIVGATHCVNEQELIAELEANRPDLVKLDQVKLNPANVKYANIEPCDFFSDKRQFIHLKDGHSSGPISHLWFQGVVSAQAFISDPEFRKKLRARVKTLNADFAELLPRSTDKVVREDYQVIYGIMRKPYADGSIGLPFFSKVSLYTAASRIRDEFGIPLAIELIPKPASDDDQPDDED